MDFRNFKNRKGGVTGLCVFVDCIAGRDDAVLEGLTANFTKDRSESILPVSIGYVKTKGDYVIPMLVQDMAEVDDLLIDKVRSVDGVSDIKSYLFNMQVPRPDEDEVDEGTPLMAHGIIFVDVEGGKDRACLDAIAALGDDEVSINFLGHCFHSFDCDMVVFVSARSHARLFEWVKEKIRPIDGILDTDVEIISGMEPLLSMEEAQALMEELATLD